ncbi:MAG: shikimate dehydrogenase [Candidatus Adiutrix sp.]|jgi:shikimate dehydrogenase|nr:shikimate dehydrogenase [Candidatus Adiutrix sp.]
MVSFSPPQVYGIIGQPLEHSLSPLIHTIGFQSLGLDAVLTPWPMGPEKLPLFFEAFRLLNFQGACVTRPHKEAVLPFLDEISDRARTLGAVNLIHWRDGLIRGDNTDAQGFLAPLKNRGLPPATRVLLLGAGGAARAVAAGLRELGLGDLTVCAPSDRRPAELARDFGLKAAPWDRRGEIPCEMVVNATPLGLAGRGEGETAYQAEWFAGRPGLAYDLVYTPRMTRFLAEARAAGWETIDGLAMFMGQAEAQFLAWTGRRLPPEAGRKAAEALDGPAATCQNRTRLL